MGCSRQAPLSTGSPDKNTGVGCRALLQGVSPTQGWDPHLLCLLHCRWVLYHQRHLGCPRFTIYTIILLALHRTSPSAVGPAVLGCEKQLKKKSLQTWWNILDHLGRREHEGESPSHPPLAFCPGDAPQIGGPVGWTDATQGTTAGSPRMAWFCIHGETTGRGGNWADSQLPWVRGTGQGERHIPPSCGSLSDAQTSSSHKSLS